MAGLLDELGYPATAPEVVARLERLAAFPSAIVLVAVIDDRVAGVATGHLLPSIHAGPVIAWLTALVVDSSARGRGIGRQLAAAVEDWARRAGAVRVSVTSGSHREGAHAFYESIGYVGSGMRLTKQLDQRGATTT